MYEADRAVCETHAIHEEAVDKAKQTVAPEEQVESLARVFKALGDPTRVRIIQALLSGELCVCDIAVVLEMSQSAVSHQLRILRDLHIVRNRRDGRIVYYALDDDHVVQLVTQATEHVSHMGGGQKA